MSIPKPVDQPSIYTLLNPFPATKLEPETLPSINMNDEALIESIMNFEVKIDRCGDIGESKPLQLTFPYLKPAQYPRIPVVRDLNLVPTLEDTDDGGLMQTPPSTKLDERAVSLLSESQLRSRGRRRSARAMSENEEKDRPDWLPPDWRIEYRLREAGATAGLVDKYYYAPVCGRQFRSKKQVLDFIETGTRRKYKAKLKDKSTSSNMTPSSSSGSSEQIGSSSETNEETALSYGGILNQPETVSWVLNSHFEPPGSWTAFVCGERVPEHTRLEWDAAFASILPGSIQSGWRGSKC